MLKASHSDKVGYSSLANINFTLNDFHAVLAELTQNNTKMETTIFQSGWQNHVLQSLVMPLNTTSSDHSIIFILP